MKKYHEIGDRIELTLPYSEVCMHMRVAGTKMTVEILDNGMAQLRNSYGYVFSSPITWGEAGIYTDYTDRANPRPYTTEE